jgi:L-fuculose-phosphate aldolase
MKHQALRRGIVAACIHMNARGINQGTSGNISVRVPEGFLITPSGMTYEETEPGDIVTMRLDGTPDPEISGALAALPLDILVAGKDEP